MLDQADGILIKNGEINLLSDAIIKLIDDNAYRYKLGRNARENILRFDTPVVIKKWEQLFEKMQ